MNELCFVWGPPLSGQRCWMARAVQDAKEGVRNVLIPIEYHAPEPELFEVLKQVGAELDRPSSGTKTIYVELPWSVVEDDLFLEDWLRARPEFMQENGKWSLSFVGVCPADAERLPETYRRGLEEFARASQSIVIVIKMDGDKKRPEWLGTDTLDFGRKVEVFEESLWPKPTSKKVGDCDELEVDTLESLTVPFKGERTACLDLFKDLDSGVYGDIWGAEVYWKNELGQFEAFTVTQGQIFSWISENPSLIETTVLNGAMLSVVGGPLKKAQLLQALRSQTFC